MYRHASVNLFLLGLFLLAMVSVVGCAAYSVAPVTGILYTDVKGPIAVTDEDDAPKVGRASMTSLLGLIATGDASIQAAAANGDITKIQHVDFESKSVLGVVATFTTVVYGE